jgi:hypothetical protein
LAGSSALLVGITGGTNTSSVVLVNSAGRTVATASAKPRFIANVAAPWISVSASRVYYLDGNSDIRWIKPDGSKGLATSIAFKNGQQISFAVSSDDERIAVSVLTYGAPLGCGKPCTRPPTFLGMKLSVGSLAGSRTMIFDSTQVTEVPVGWYSGSLVVGVIPAFCCQSVTPNPFSITEYHVVNPVGGKRLRTLCPVPTHSLGHPQREGTLCGTGRPNSPLSWQSWDGKSASASTTPAEFTGAAFLAPGAQKFALDVGGILVSTIQGGPLQFVQVGPMLGWLDSDHLAAFRGLGDPDVRVLVDLRKTGLGVEGALTTLPPMIVVGVFPGGLG